MEAPWEIVVDVVADLNTMDTSGYVESPTPYQDVVNGFIVYSGVLVGSRILCFSPNISLRLYPQWAQRLLNLPALPKSEVYKTNDSIEVTVCLLMCLLH